MPRRPPGQPPAPIGRPPLLGDRNLDRMVGVRLDRELFDAFAAFCEERGMVMSEILRRLVVSCVRTRKVP